MTPTPSVADVLADPTTGAAGVFPDDINLSFNDHNRLHLVHAPDPVVRPGAMNWASSHNTTVPEAGDRYLFAKDEFELKIVPKSKRIKLGEPLYLSWELVNNLNEPIPAPNDIRIETLLSHIIVTNPNGFRREMPSFVMETDAVTIQDMDPGKKLEAETMLFWSSNGFAFENPGKHTIEIQILWNHAGIPFGVTASADVWVDYPISDEDNEVASLLMNEEVGRYISLGGGAKHLKKAGTRIEEAMSKYSEHSACKCILELEGKGHKECA